MKLNVKALAATCGILCGLALALLTWWYVIRGYDPTVLDEIGNVYLGYSVSWTGGLVGLVYGLIDGAIAGALVAWVYNLFVDRFTET